MLEDYINSELSEIFDSIPPLTSFITMREIEDFKIDSFYMEFLKTELLWRLYGGFINHVNNRNILFDINDFEDLFNEYSGTLIQKMGYSPDEFRDMIQLAVNYRVKFILEPVDTISSLLFTNSYSLTNAEFSIKSLYFPKNIFIFQEIKDKFNNSMEFSFNLFHKNDFDKEIYDIFRNLLNSQNNDKIAEIINPLSLFNPEQPDSVLNESLRTFLDDIKLHQLYELFNESYGDDEYIKINSIVELIQNFDFKTITSNIGYKIKIDNKPVETKEVIKKAVPELKESIVNKTTVHKDNAGFDLSPAKPFNNFDLQSSFDEQILKIRAKLANAEKVEIQETKFNLSDDYNYNDINNESNDDFSDNYSENYNISTEDNDDSTTDLKSKLQKTIQSFKYALNK